ncbi:MAG: glycosyltransferase [Planctomycetota bacterium]
MGVRLRLWIQICFRHIAVAVTDTGFVTLAAALCQKEVAKRAGRGTMGDMEANPDISAVIVTRNRRDALDAAIASVRAQQGVAAEIIVVDNGSADGTAGHVRAAHPDVRLVCFDRNQGAPGGRNAGAAAARAPLLFFLDDDAALTDPDAFGRARAAFAADPALGVVFGAVLNAHTGAPEWREFTFQRAPGIPPRPVYTSLFLAGAAFIPAAVYRNLGGYDASFFCYAEEFDLALRLIAAGRRILFRPDITLRHAAHPNRIPSGTARMLNMRNYLLAHWKSLPTGTACAATIHCLATRLAGAAREGWILRYPLAVAGWLARMPGILLRGRRRPMDRAAFQRLLQLNAATCEDHAELERRPPLSLAGYVRAVRANRRARREAGGS